MEVMAQGNRHIVDSDSKVDNNVVRQKVMDSYQDMLSGKGRDYKVFFAELERVPLPGPRRLKNMQHTEARTQPPHCGSCVCRYGRIRRAEWHCQGAVRCR